MMMVKNSTWTEWSTIQGVITRVISKSIWNYEHNYSGHLAAPTTHLIGDHPSGLTKEQRTETMNPSP